MFENARLVASTNFRCVLVHFCNGPRSWLEPTMGKEDSKQF